MLPRESLESAVFKTAIMWSVIQKKRNMQQASIGKDSEEIYILNRIYAPIFQISVRTRGGFNVEITKEEFSDLIQKQEEQIIELGESKEEDGQMSIFDYEWGSVDE